jgi:hypothetical protein
MDRRSGMIRIGFSLLSVIFVIGFLVSGSSHAEESQILSAGIVATAEAVETVEMAPGSNPQAPNSCQQVTVEHLIAMDGVKGFCGAYCGHNPSNQYCTSCCGEPAGCVNNYCIYF